VNKFDVIVIDPPPPVEAAGSSHLYSEEFYELAKKHLRPNGILQAWFPGQRDKTGQAVLRSLRNSFPYLRCFASSDDSGLLILASLEPIASLTPQQVAMAMPPAAVDDLLEWSSTRDLPDYLAEVLVTEFPIEQALDADRRIRITDDHPYNEYFLCDGGVFSDLAAPSPRKREGQRGGRNPNSACNSPQSQSTNQSLWIDPA
jgi:hypothetical protein